MAPAKKGSKFSVEHFLQDMRDETRSSHVEIKDKLDEVARTVNQHETRLTVVENARKTLRWVVGAVLVAFIGSVMGLLFGLIRMGP